MRKWIVAAGFLAMAGLALAACSGDGDNTSFGGTCPGKTPPAAQIDDDMSVEELVDLVAEAITCPEYALHVRWTGDNESGPYSYRLETESWVDVEDNVGRTESLYEATSEEALAEAERAEAEGEEYSLAQRGVGITTGDGSFYIDGDEPVQKGRIANCYDEGREALALVIPCHNGPLQDIEISIDTSAQYQGRPAIAYVGAGTSRGSDETSDTVSSNFYDAQTFLPIGETHVGTLDIGEIYQVSSDFSYKTAFVPLDSLPDDFFDPASLGYVEPDPYEVEAPLDNAEVPVYWLGREFAGEGEFPALVLEHAFVRAEARSGLGGSVVEMTYRPADDEFGHNLARIELLSSKGWDDREAITVQWPCEQTVDFEVNGHDARLKIHHHSNRQAEDGSCLPPDRYSAVIHFEEVVVALDAPATGNGRERFYSPYDSEEGIKLLARSLRLRE